jgi:hypothetical protein
MDYGMHVTTEIWHLYNFTIRYTADCKIFDGFKYQFTTGKPLKIVSYSALGSSYELNISRSCMYMHAGR